MWYQRTRIHGSLGYVSPEAFKVAARAGSDHHACRRVGCNSTDDILSNVVRAVMTVSLETRVPLLDYQVVEFAWRIPAHFNSRNDSAKWLLKQIAFRHVPPALLERP